MSVLENRARGMLLGVMLGDALGAPFEFANKPETFDGKITSVHKRTNQYNWTVIHELGQVTDDTEMACALMHVLVSGYSIDRAVLEYHEFVNSGTFSIGNNTRALLKGYKSKVLAQYKLRVEQQFPDEQTRNASQSNGHLMRCAPIALIDDPSVRRNIAVSDTAITNPSRVCSQIVLIYIELLSKLIRTNSPTSVDECVQNTIDSLDAPLDPIVQQAITDAENETFTRVLRSTSEVKATGWSAHSFSVSLWAVKFCTSFEHGMDCIVKFGGDTDTNAAIAGALLGAKFGETLMRAETFTPNNISIVLGCEPKTTTGKFGNMKVTPRPPKYYPQTLLDNLHLIDQSKFSAVDFQTWYNGVEAAPPPQKRAPKQREKRDVDGIVIAVSGASQSGKTTLCKALVQQLGKGNCKLISQDSFRFASLPKRELVDGKVSWEGSKFTDFEKLAASITVAKQEYEIVFVEGYTLLDSGNMWDMADRVYWIESDQATGAARRSKFPGQWGNAAHYYDRVVWPSHLSYKERVDGNISAHSAPFTRLEPNSEVADLVKRIMEQLGKATESQPDKKRRVCGKARLDAASSSRNYSSGDDEAGLDV